MPVLRSLDARSGSNYENSTLLPRCVLFALPMCVCVRAYVHVRACVLLCIGIVMIVLPCLRVGALCYWQGVRVRIATKRNTG